MDSKRDPNALTALREQAFSVILELTNSERIAVLSEYAEKYNVPLFKEAKNGCNDVRHERSQKCGAH